MKIIKATEVKCFIIQTDCIIKSGKTSYYKDYRRINYEEGKSSWEQYVFGSGWEDCFDSEEKELEELFLHSKVHEFLK